MSDKKTVREACRRRMPLDGADAQALEHAVTITERERDEARDRVAELEAEVERLCAERDELEAEHLSVAGMLADVVDALRGEGWCEEHGYGSPVADVNDLRRQLQQTRADYGTADHERRELLEFAHEAEERAAELDVVNTRLIKEAKRWRAMFEAAGRLVGDMVEMHGLAGDEATEEIARWLAAAVEED